MKGYHPDETIERATSNIFGKWFASNPSCPSVKNCDFTIFKWMNEWGWTARIAIARQKVG